MTLHRWLRAFTDAAVAFEFAQERSHAHEPSIEDLPGDTQQILEQRIGDGVPNHRALTRGGHDPAAAQPCQLLRDNRLVDPECLLQLLDARLSSVHEHLEQADTDRVRERPKKLGFESL